MALSPAAFGAFHWEQCRDTDSGLEKLSGFIELCAENLTVHSASNSIYRYIYIYIFFAGLRAYIFERLLFDTWFFFSVLYVAAAALSWKLQPSAYILFSVSLHIIRKYVLNSLCRKLAEIGISWSFCPFLVVQYVLKKEEAFRHSKVRCCLGLFSSKSLQHGLLV